MEAKSKSKCLRSILYNFNSTRNVNVDPAAKQKARDYIVKTFKDRGLHTWTEEFPSNNDQVNRENVCVQECDHENKRSKITR